MKSVSPLLTVQLRDMSFSFNLFILKQTPINILKIVDTDYLDCFYDYIDEELLVVTSIPYRDNTSCLFKNTYLRILFIK